MDCGSLENTAHDAWCLATTFRRSPNWGKAVAAANKSTALLRAAHPRIRRLAADICTVEPEDLCA
jgi:hypothetical protein